MNEQQKPWPGFNYQQVPGLANRHIARWLRSQRKNMIRFFHERRMYEFEERMLQIRKSRQGMLAKNRMFQEVLNAYARRTSPPAAAEAVAPQTEGNGHVAVRAEAGRGPAVDHGNGTDAGGRVPPVADQNDGPDVVIEE
jgi:hypothetical protein